LIVFAGKMGGGTAPAILSGKGGYAGGNGIHFDIAGSGKQICFVHGKRGESFLPKVSTPPFPEIDPPCVSTMGFTNCSRQPFFGFRNGNEMNMVRHKAISPDLNLIFAAPLGHQGQIGFIVIVVKKGLLSTVASLRDVVRKSRSYYSCYACHGETIP